MATIRKHRDKYQVQIRRKGVAPLTKTFTLLADAKEWARHQERLADRAELGPDRKVLERITLAQLVQRYIDEVVPGKKGAEIERIVLGAFLRQRICKKRLSELTTADFATYRDERLKTISTKTLKRQIAPLSNMFEIARMFWNVPLRSNPLTDLVLKVEDNKRDRRLRQGEFEQLLQAGLKTRNRQLIPIVRLALETAMRRGELLALRFRDVNIERCMVTIRESKNGYSRTIPLSSKAVTLLGTAIALMSDKAKSQNARIFPVTPIAVRLAWDKLTKRARIDDLHFHDLRHEAISRLFELGLTVPEVASISGHRTLAQLMRYSHANQEVVRAKLLLGRERDGEQKTPERKAISDWTASV